MPTDLGGAWSAPIAYVIVSDSIVPLAFPISTADAVLTCRLSLQSLVFNCTATAFAVPTNYRDCTPACRNLPRDC